VKQIAKTTETLNNKRDVFFILKNLIIKYNTLLASIFQQSLCFTLITPFYSSLYK
jgi:hypothetical protein